MDTAPLTGPGEIAQGDIIHCTFGDKQKRYTAREILNPGTEYEEVIIDIRKNKYFITSMAIDGSSWAKNVMIQKH